MFGNVIAESFLGGDVRKVKVDGVSVAVLGARLATLACDQMFDKLYLDYFLIYESNNLVYIEELKILF